MNISISTLEKNGCLRIIRTLKHLQSCSVQALSSEMHRANVQGCKARQLPHHSAPWCPKAALYPVGTNLKPVKVNAHPELTIRVRIHLEEGWVLAPRIQLHPKTTISKTSSQHHSNIQFKNTHWKQYTPRLQPTVTTFCVTMSFSTLLSAPKCNSALGGSRWSCLPLTEL